MHTLSDSFNCISCIPSSLGSLQRLRHQSPASSVVSTSIRPQSSFGSTTESLHPFQRISIPLPRSLLTSNSSCRGSIAEQSPNPPKHPTRYRLLPPQDDATLVTPHSSVKLTSPIRHLSIHVLTRSRTLSTLSFLPSPGTDTK